MHGGNTRTVHKVRRQPPIDTVAIWWALAATAVTQHTHKGQQAHGSCFVLLEDTIIHLHQAHQVGDGPSLLSTAEYMVHALSYSPPVGRCRRLFGFLIPRW